MSASSSAPSATALRPGVPPAALLARRGIDPRWYSSSLLTLILVIGQWHFQILGDDYSGWALALGTALLTELVLSRALRGEWPNLLSAYISGNSVAILLKPLALFWFPITSIVSIASKYVIQYRGRHLCNPTNFGVCIMLLAAPGSLTMLSHEWGNDWVMVAVIWSVGLLVVWRAKVWHLTITYLVAFVALAALRSALNGDPLQAELAPVTGPMYQLFMFFMVTDPKTIVRGRAKQVGVVLLVACVECAIRLACDWDWVPSDESHWLSPLRAAPPMFALFLVGPPAYFLDLWLANRRATMRA